MRVGSEPRDVVADGIKLRLAPAFAVAAADQGIFLVAGKVVIDAPAQQGTDLLQMLLPIFVAGLRRSPSARRAQLLLMRDVFPGMTSTATT